ncbi:hypothetical protein [Ornithinibacillus xuwenensis]|uniref:Histidine kinase n=1 Tax=Ornithinibacillus xuwenensis TaxID=3144668 RepID=A0ABU9XDB8_9BACI
MSLGGFHIQRKVIGIGVLVFAMLTLLYMIMNDYDALNLATQRISDEIGMLSFRIAVWAYLFGILSEWRAIQQLINKEIKVNLKLLIPSLFLTTLVFIPNIYWLKWFGSPMPKLEHLFINIFIIPETHMVVSVLAGILFIRSFTKN